mmetsp:Transcript_22840/g.58754  ORF Transcript_22840/g.58754 Transcript_22840/m.58754 type:complete len:130 (-) Transcript_22840:148-537(-)
MADAVDAEAKELFQKLEEFFFGDDVQETFEAWAKAHAAKFATRPTMEDEHSLEHMEVYKEFLAMYEAKLEGFVGAQGWTHDRFMSACKAELAKDQDASEHGFILRVIQGMAEYNMFLQLMQEVVPSGES